MFFPTRIALLLTLLILTASVQAHALTVITENNPPFSFTANYQPTGIATDIFLIMARRSGIKMDRSDIQIWPWARGYKEIQENDSVILFPMAKTDSRKDLFQWIGPIMPSKSCMIARAHSGFQINDLKRDTDELRIGTIRDSASEQFVLKNGLDLNRLQRVHSIKLNIKKLIEGRIDAMLLLEATLLYTIQDMGLTSDEFEVVNTLFSSQLYFAASKDMNPDLVRKLQHSLDELRQENTVDTIIEDYLH
ncbi:substrate-binding periplasmic protein [Pseudodesulfovibrio sediminis]|uniref:Amino acid ABC transporter substrate-binding protein n=1 Tax=Pseudodesulfovibrio sediminis TaxID=2810563 RepID=A0ABM7P6K3_9BACT|nr:transporter substrate-binding domain-containing protein [Pseudodesulfovibrio sediminis]BCS88578.1 amino acid ABC transporter substrate-binding protein [Pseudodesulfovibrio sediminis]